jgi:hypothetical protein
MKRTIATIVPVFLITLFLSACQTPAPMERPITVELTVPDPAWQIRIERVLEGSDELHVISRVKRDPEVMAAQVISRASDTVRVAAPDLPVRHHVLGKTWGWSEENYNYVKDEEALLRQLSGSRSLYRR